MLIFFKRYKILFAALFLIYVVNGFLLTQATFAPSDALMYSSIILPAFIFICLNRIRKNKPHWTPVLMAGVSLYSLYLLYFTITYALSYRLNFLSAAHYLTNILTAAALFAFVYKMIKTQETEGQSTIDKKIGV